MTLENIVVWIIIGGIAGILADAVIKEVRVGLIGSIVIGVLGALIGGWLFQQLHISVGSGFLSEVFTAFVGAVVLLNFVAAVAQALTLPA